MIGPSPQLNNNEWEPWLNVSSIRTVDLPSLLYITMLFNYDILKALILLCSTRVCQLFFVFVYTTRKLTSHFLKVERLPVNLIHWINYAWIFFSTDPCLLVPCLRVHHSTNLQTNWQIFMKLDMNIMSLEAILTLDFIILYHQCYQHGTTLNFCNWGNASTITNTLPVDLKISCADSSLINMQFMLQ